MDNKSDITSKLSLRDTINPNEFDVSISALLVGLGAEEYIEIFRKNNIGQCTLIELTDEDLIKLGVSDSKVRHKLLEEVKNLPVYNELVDNTESKPNLNPIEVVRILEDSSQHLYRIYLSMMTNTLALKRSNTGDCLINDNLYASQIALSSLRHMTEKINVMEIALHPQFKVLSKEKYKRKTKKALVATLGSALIAILGVCFIRSLKNL